MKPVKLSRASLALVSALTLSPAVLAGEDDWVCEHPHHLNPPMGCSLHGPQLTKGLCTSHVLTGVWHCVTAWTPRSSGPGPGGGSTSVKSTLALPGNTLVHHVYELLSKGDTQRSARLAIDADALLASNTPIPILEIAQAPDAAAILVSAVRSADGVAQLALSSVNAHGAPTLLATLPLRRGQSTVIANWSTHPVNGPRLSLASGISSMEASLAALDGQSLLRLWNSPVAQMHFDIARPQAPMPHLHQVESSTIR